MKYFRASFDLKKKVFFHIFLFVYNAFLCLLFKMSSSREVSEGEVKAVSFGRFSKQPSQVL